MDLKNLAYRVHYAWNLLALLNAGCITFPTAVSALKEMPTAVAGKGGSFVVDPTFDC